MQSVELAGDRGSANGKRDGAADGIADVVEERRRMLITGIGEERKNLSQELLRV